MLSTLPSLSELSSLDHGQSGFDLVAGMGVSLAGGSGDSVLVGLPCRRQVAGHFADQSLLVVGIQVAGIQLQNLLEVAQGLAQLAGFLVFQSQAVEQEDVVGLPLEQGLKLMQPV